MLWLSDSLLSAVTLAAVDRIKLSLILLGGALTSLGFGGKLICMGWQGFRNGEYPMTEKTTLRGLSGRLAALVMLTFGLIVVGCGIAILFFCLQMNRVR